MLRSVFLTLTGTTLTAAALAQNPASSTSSPAPTSAEPVNPYPAASLGLSLGWGAPYGLGLDYSHLLGKRADIGVGAGLGIGGKIGVGARYYFRPAAALKPYAGVNLVRSGRVNDLNVTRNTGGTSETTRVSIASSALVHLRGGLRWQQSNIALLGTLGYGIVASGGTYTYASGPRPSQAMQDAVDLFGPGGVEVSFGFSVGLGH